MNPKMQLSDKIYVAGHRGLMGSALVRALQQARYHNLIMRSHQDCDLTDKVSVDQLFASQKPDYVFLAAAKVGGILANHQYPADFIRENLAIELNVIEAAYRHGVKRLLFMGSSCIYPRNCRQPMREDYLLSGELESTNRPYALAKIAGIELCWSYNRQYGTQFFGVMPTNLYGQRDNYDLQTSHVIPALIRKMHEAKVNKSPTVEIWGTGKPKREFLFSDDCAKACLQVMNLSDDAYHEVMTSDIKPPLINIGCGEDLTIQALSKLTKAVVGYTGKLVFNSDKPDGTPRKLLDISKLKSIGFSPEISLEEGLKRAYDDFLQTEMAQDMATCP